MPSKYTITNELVKGCKISFISLMKDAQGIHQPERHDQPFEKSPLGFEGSLPHIGGFDRYLVVTKLQVNLTEIFPPLRWSRRSLINGIGYLF